MICLAIDNPATCEIHAVIHFLYARNMSAAEIHHKLCAVYIQNEISEGTVKKNGVECSKVGEQMYTMKSKVVGYL
jgi:hypothetical protein